MRAQQSSPIARRLPQWESADKLEREFREGIEEEIEDVIEILPVDKPSPLFFEKPVLVIEKNTPFGSKPLLSPIFSTSPTMEPKQAPILPNSKIGTVGRESGFDIRNEKWKGLSFCRQEEADVGEEVSAFLDSLSRSDLASETGTKAHQDGRSRTKRPPRQRVSTKLCFSLIGEADGELDTTDTADDSENETGQARSESGCRRRRKAEGKKQSRRERKRGTEDRDIASDIEAKNDEKRFRILNRKILQNIHRMQEIANEQHRIGGFIFHNRKETPEWQDLVREQTDLQKENLALRRRLDALITPGR